MKKDWQGGSYVVLKRKFTVTGEKPLLSIGCKYNYWKFLSFISVYDAESKNSGIDYIPNYP